MRTALVVLLISAAASAGGRVRVELPDEAKVQKILLVHEHDWVWTVPDSKRVGEIEITPRGLRIRLNVVGGANKVKWRRKGDHVIIEYAKRRGENDFVPLMMMARRVYAALVKYQKGIRLPDKDAARLQLWLDGESHKAEVLK